ncbi:Glycerol uptake facilitator protein [Klebsiella pneumoniae IS39]|nr:Glycerol uptake facilitator protein [Klebsiella pneumoniae IS39]
MGLDRLLPVGWRSLTFWCRCWRRWWGRLSGRFFLYRKLIGRHLPCECGIDE